MNARFQLLFVHGDLSPYLRFPTDTPSNDLLRMARRGVHTCLRRVVGAAIESEQAIVSERSRMLAEDGTYQAIEIHGRRFVPGTETEACVLISFRTLADRARPEPPAGEEARGVDEYVLHMEHELQAARHENRRLDDELQATRQALKTTHEEAPTINEELESSKEELQSLNEDLSTVNNELNEKMTAPREVTSNLENLLDSADISTFLDAEQRIKRFTPAARRLFSLIDSDVGRPLSDISHVFEGPLDIERDAASVKREREPVENEVHTRDGQWFLRRITPYRAKDKAITGAVLSFLDVTPLKQAERGAAANEERFRAIYHDNPAMYFILDPTGDITSVNEFAAHQLGYACNELVGRSFEGLHEDPRDLRGHLEACRDRPGQIVRWDLRLRNKNGTMIWVHANGRLTAASGQRHSQRRAG